MKIVWSIFIFIIVNSYSTAYATNRKTTDLLKDVPFLKRWMANPLIKSKSGNSFKTFKRFVSLDKRVFPVGSISTFFYKTVTTADITQLSNKLKKSFVHGTFKQSSNGSKIILTGKLLKFNRNVRYVLSFKKRNGLYLSFATYRAGYSDSVESEILLLQSKLYDHFTNKNNISFLNFISDIVLPEVISAPFAFPIGAPGIGQGAGSSTLPPSLSGLNPNDVANLTTGITDLNSNLLGLQGELNSSNTNWATTNTHLADYNTNIENATNVIDKNWSDSNNIIDKNLTETNRILDESSKGMLGEAKRANDLAEKLSKPETVFALGAASAAGAVIGASIAGLVIDGVVLATNKIIDMITDASGKEERWTKFSEAMKQWEDVNAKLANAEMALDQFLLSGELLAKLKKVTPSNNQDILSNEGILMELSFQESEGNRLKEEYLALMKNGNRSCRRIFHNESYKIEKKIKELQNISLLLNKSTFSPFNTNEFCNELNGIIGKFAESEAYMHKLRINILNGKNEWLEFNDSQLQEMYDSTENVNNDQRRKDYRDKQIKNAKNQYDRVQREIRNNKSEFNKRCQSIDGRKAKFKEQLDCRNRYKKNRKLAEVSRLNLAMQAMNQLIEKAKSDYISGKNKIINVSSDVQNMNTTSYLDFFKKLENQAACESGTSDDCSNVLKSFNSLKKAKITFDQICNKDLMN